MFFVFKKTVLRSGFRLISWTVWSDPSFKTMLFIGLWFGCVSCNQFSRWGEREKGFETDFTRKVPLHWSWLKSYSKRFFFFFLKVIKLVRNRIWICLVQSDFTISLNLTVLHIECIIIRILSLLICFKLVKK